MEVVSSGFFCLKFNLADGVKPSPWEKRKSLSGQSMIRMFVDVCVWSGTSLGSSPTGSATERS